MKLAVIASLASFLAAFAAASWIYSGNKAREEGSVLAPASPSFDADLPVEDRIAALERAVSDERVARQLLQEEVVYLTSELDRLSADQAFAEVDRAPAEESVTATADSGLSRREEWRRRNSPENRMQRLIEAGFLPSQASMIVQRESELQMEAIQARYEAERNDEPFDFFGSREATDQALREDLGDTDYERYLEANDRSTSVSVSSVIESSPAHSAGLQAGDEIVRYNGERVFSMSDLTREALEGTAGQNVVVDIMRNGTPMQVVLPRGPIGITGGRRSR